MEPEQELHYGDAAVAQFRWLALNTLLSPPTDSPNPQEPAFWSMENQ